MTTKQRGDSKTTLTHLCKKMTDEQYCHVVANLLAMKGGESTFLLTKFKSLT